MRLIHAREHGGPGRLESYRTDLLGKDGARVPVLVSAALIIESGEPVGSVGVFTDLRERLRMEAQLSEAQEELRAREKQALIAELAGAAAHELNQPLTSVLGYAELIRRRRRPTPRPSQSAAAIILQEAERMAEIVRKIGKITRYETKTLRRRGQDPRSRPLEQLRTAGEGTTRRPTPANPARAGERRMAAEGVKNEPRPSDAPAVPSTQRQRRRAAPGGVARSPARSCSAGPRDAPFEDAATQSSARRASCSTTRPSASASRGAALGVGRAGRREDGQIVVRVARRRRASHPGERRSDAPLPGARVRAGRPRSWSSDGATLHARLRRRARFVDGAPAALLARPRWR